MLKAFNGFLFSFLLAAFSFVSISCSGGGGGGGGSENPPSSYTVSFYDDNGDTLTQYNRTVAGGTQITLPAPTKADYTFDGWRLNGSGSPLTGIYTVNANTTFVARWTATNPGVTEYTVSFYDNGNLIPELGMTVRSGSQITLPSYTKPGYVLDGWLLSGIGSPLAGSYTVNANTVFVAKWTADTPTATYTVSFYDDGNPIPELGLTEESGTEITLPLYTKHGYSLDGWLLSGVGSPLTGSYTVNANTVFVAKWTADTPTVTYAVSFYDNGNPIPELGLTEESGTEITLPVPPTKTDYTFDGWLLNGTGNPLTGTHTVNANTIFIAKWTSTTLGVTEYTVSFYDNGTVLPEFSRALTSGAQITLPAPTKTGYTFNGWLLNGTGELLTGTHTVNANAIFIAKWTATNPGITEYTVSFYDNGVVLPEFSRALASGAQITLPTPTKTGYAFNGWLLGGIGAPLTGTYTVNADSVFTAKWTSDNPDVTEYSVIFYDNDDADNTTVLPEFGVTVPSGTQISLPAFAQMGYTFDGWLKNNTGAPIKGTYTVTDNVSFYAKFTLAQYTVSYYDENGQIYDDIGGTVSYGSTVTLPPRTKIGHTFDGWLENNTGSFINGTYTVTEDVAFNASFTIAQHTVSYYDENGQIYNDIGGTAAYGSTVTLPPRTKIGHTFDGWLKNNAGSLINGTYTVTEDVTFHARFTTAQYTVSYYDENGLIYGDIGTTAAYGTVITLPSRTKIGHTFTGWLRNNTGSLINGTYTVTGNMYFYAKFTPTQYTVSYYDENGVKYSDIGRTAAYGTVITLPPRTKIGHTFDGWLKNNAGSPINGTYTVTEDVAFHARFTIVQHMVAYYDEDGLMYNDIGGGVNYGGTVTMPPRTKIGHTFDGWLKNNTGPLINGTYTVTDDVSFHAKFTAMRYMVSYYDEGGLLYDDIGGETDYGSTITLPPGTKPGYTFDGWLIDNVGSPIKGTYTVTEDVSFHAKFTLAYYTVVYYDEKGQIYDDIGEEDLTYGTAINLPARTKPDYTFEGWFENRTGAPINGTYTVTGDVSFYAKFILTGATPITSALESYNIRQNLSGKYVLLNNITLAAYGSGAGWDPIGTEAAPFTGILDGDGYKITDLYVNRAVAGLFGYIGSGAVINNLTVEIAASGVRGSSYAGGLAGLIRGTAENTAVISDVHIAGGTGAVRASNSSPNTSIYSGGVAGYLDNATLSDCGNTGGVTSSSSSSYHSSSSGNTNRSSSYSGGIAGYILSATAITNCYNAGTATATTTTTSSYSNSYNDSHSYSYSYSGGIAGYIYTGAVTITNCYNNGNVTSTDTSTSSAYPYSSYNTYSSSYSYSYSGGIAGYISDGAAAIASGYNTGDITSSSSSNASPTPTSSLYSSSYSYSYSGGIAGYGNNLNISGNYSLGTVTGNSTSSPSSNQRYTYIGGIVGYIANGSVINSAAINTELKTASGGTTLLGRVGNLNLAPTNLTVTNNFAWDEMPATGAPFASTDSATHGISKTDIELQTADTYTDTIYGNGLGGLGWQFGNDDEHPWKMPDGGGYPILYWQE
jgi:uncharacterized repeat protein (TIGR02543 family)